MTRYSKLFDKLFRSPIKITIKQECYGNNIKRGNILYSSKSFHVMVQYRSNISVVITVGLQVDRGNCFSLMLPSITSEYESGFLVLIQRKPIGARLRIAAN